jgi:hypothetical protein
MFMGKSGSERKKPRAGKAQGGDIVQRVTIPDIVSSHKL